MRAYTYNQSPSAFCTATKEPDGSTAIGSKVANVSMRGVGEVMRTCIGSGASNFDIAGLALSVKGNTGPLNAGPSKLLKSLRPTDVLSNITG